MKNNIVSFLMRFVVLLVMFFVVPLMVTAREVGYSAMVMDVKGKVFARHGGVNKSVDLGYLLYPGDSVEATKDASLTITYLESGQEEQWPGGANFVVEKSGSRPVPAKITKKNRINLPQIASPQKGSATMIRVATPQRGGVAMKSMPPPQRGGTAMYEMDKPQKNVLELTALNTVEVINLSNTSTIEERPVFRWRPAPSAQNYEVKFYSLSKDEPVWQRTTKDAMLSFPSDVPPLSPGYEYQWSIEAFKDGQVVTQKRSCFSLPPGNELTEIKKEVNNYRGQLEVNATDSAIRLRFIFFLEEYKLYDEALEQYMILQKQRGESDSLTERQRKITELRNATCPTY